ncbi:hypothetical protein O181_051430 [Austropuccinia psidii MF-1]|uniref:Uncharacterized protein n=1 Tax=Austropuccinia psidii MF-1 TaxID=1389203 RepID=A0A9Q3E319_9BASI|nr:hypothetical protein [Austropuccinia psidii MF-1]
MSSSKPRKSRSGSVHDSDSLHIDVGNPKAPTSSTWSIPNISVTPIPPNTTNTQMHVSQGPEGTPQISSNTNPQSKFPREFLLNPGQNPVASQDPFGRSKQPTLNNPSGSQVHVGNEKRVDCGKQKRPLEKATCSGLLEGNPELTLHQNIAPKGKSVQSQEPIEDCDEVYASSPLVYEEKLPGLHHPYASKPRTGHAKYARSIRDETAKEQGLQSSQCGKTCKLEGEKKFVKAKLAENVHGTRSAVHVHFLFLLKVRDKDFSSLPEPPRTEEREIAIQVAGHLEYVPKDVFNEPSTQVQSQCFQSYYENELHKLGLGVLMETSIQQVDVYGVLPYIPSHTCQHQVSSLLLEQGS